MQISSLPYTKLGLIYCKHSTIDIKPFVILTMFLTDHTDDG